MNPLRCGYFPFDWGKGFPLLLTLPRNAFSLTFKAFHLIPRRTKAVFLFCSLFGYQIPIYCREFIFKEELVPSVFLVSTSSWEPTPLKDESQHNPYIYLYLPYPINIITIQHKHFSIYSLFPLLNLLASGTSDSAPLLAFTSLPTPHPFHLFLLLLPPQSPLKRFTSHPFCTSLNRMRSIPCKTSFCQPELDHSAQLLWESWTDTQRKHSEKIINYCWPSILTHPSKIWT